MNTKSRLLAILWWIRIGPFRLFKYITDYDTDITALRGNSIAPKVTARTLKRVLPKFLLRSRAPASGGFFAEAVGTRQGCSLTLHERANFARP